MSNPHDEVLHNVNVTDLLQDAAGDNFADQQSLSYPEMPIKSKFIKSVDEGTFNRLMKQKEQVGATVTHTLNSGGRGSHKEAHHRGSSHNTIEHTGFGQLNQFSQPLHNSGNNDSGQQFKGSSM